jgi:hypothetical protein
MGGVGGGAQRPVWGANKLKKTGARSARARTRGQNPLVLNKKARQEKVVPHIICNKEKMKKTDQKSLHLKCCRTC